MVFFFFKLMNKQTVLSSARNLNVPMCLLSVLVFSVVKRETGIDISALQVAKQQQQKQPWYGM